MKIFVNLLAANEGGQRTRALAFHKNVMQSVPNVNFVFLKYNGTFEYFVTAANISVIEIKTPRKGLRSIRRIIWENLFLKSQIEKSGCDVYLNFSHYLPVFRLAQKSVLAVSNLAPFVNEVVVNEKFWNSMKLRILKRTILRSAKKANAVIALSETCRRILISHGICSESITVIPNGVDQVTSLRDKDTTTEHEGAASYILCVSHFYRYKNFETLIKSYKILRESIVCIHNLKIVGRFEDKTYVSELRSLIQKLDIESHVELIPEVNHSDLNVLYRNAELFIFPSIVENSPNVLIEAMSHGLPIISSNRNPMPEFGGNAISYFESHDEIELAFKMKNILLDDDLSRKFSLLALERSRHFSWEKFTLDVVTLCSYVVGNNVQRDSTQKL